MRMRFATRAFLWSFIPFAFLMGVSFWVIQQRVQSTVREGLRSSLRDAHVSIAHLRAENELQNSRFLKIVGENPSLKAGLQLLLSEPKSGAARLTVEDQLREIAETLHFDLLLVSDPDGAPLAGVVRIDDGRSEKEVKHMPMGFFSAVTPDMYIKHYKKWKELGFLRRFVVVNYDYELKTRREGNTKIRKGQISTGNLTPRQIKIPKRTGPYNVIIPDAFSGEIESLSFELARNLEAQALNLQIGRAHV